MTKRSFGAAWALWRALMALPDVGPTTASKLMARKRPRLIPIFDAVINSYALGDSGKLWVPLHAALRENGLHNRLVNLRARAGLDERVSALRVFDVLTWMTGKGYAKVDAGPSVADSATQAGPVPETNGLSEEVRSCRREVRLGRAAR